MINSSRIAKLEAEKADAREQIELVLSDAYIDKNLNSNYDENEYLDAFVKDRLENVQIDGEVIGLNGFLFELDRSVPRLGKYIGQATGPIINEINVTDKTTNSISIEVNASNADDADYTYLYKKNEETEWIEAGKGKENTFKFDNLEADKIYNIKVIVETKSGRTEQETNERTGEMPTGKITFGDVTWQDGLATVTIHTEETGYTLQYQIDNALEEGWQTIENGGAVSNLQLNQTVYARLFDGKNGTEPASESIKDGVLPVVKVTAGQLNTDRIAVSVQAIDDESGMKERPTYTYYIKKTSEEDTAYQEKATGVTNTSYTFTGLEQETNYDIKVEVDGDKAGNVGTGELKGQTTTKLPGGESAIVQGAITFGTPTWSNQRASVTINTNTSYNIQYQVNGIAEGNWQSISNGGKVGSLQDGDVVYARLTDGTNYGDYASYDIRAILINSITLNKTSATLEKNNTVQLVVTINPSNATDKSLTWTSSNTGVATVNGSGLVTGKGSGTTTITAKANDGSNKSATCTVKVEATKTLGELEESTSSSPTVIYLKEVTGYEPYLVMKHNYQNSGRILVMRMNVFDDTNVCEYIGDANVGKLTSYSGGDLDNAVSTVFYNNYLDSSVKNYITATNIPVMVSGSLSSISKKVFPLSATEVGLSSARYKEGTTLPYFSNGTKGMRDDYNDYCEYFTRTPSGFASGKVEDSGYSIREDGSYRELVGSTSVGTLIGFTLPSTFKLTEQGIQYSSEISNWNDNEEFVTKQGLKWSIESGYTNESGNNLGTVAVINHCSQVTTNIIIPKSIGGYPVAIGDSAFEGCEWIKTVEIQQGVVDIANSAFRGCTGLTSVNINSNAITSIGDYAFRGCNSLTSISLNNMTNLNFIGRRAFVECTRLKTIYMDKCTNIETIDNYAFGGGSYAMCSGSIIYVPDSRVKALFVNGTNYSSTYTTITIK